MSYTGLRGFELVVTDGSPVRPIAGLLGVTVEIEANLPIKVQDLRGRGLANVQVTITNPTSGVASIGFTDSQGNALLNADVSNPNPITVQKDKAFRIVNYTGGNSFTIILEPPIL